MEIPRTIKISNGKKFSYFLLMFGDYPIYRVDNGSKITRLNDFSDRFNIFYWNPLCYHETLSFVRQFLDWRLRDKNRPARLDDLPSWVSTDWDELYMTGGLDLDDFFWVSFDDGRTFKDISPRYWEVEEIVNDK